MPYPLLRTGGDKTFSSQLFNTSNEAVDYSTGTTFSAFTSDFNIATATVSSDGRTVTVTPGGTYTGNVVISLTATIPGNSADVYGAFWIHVMDSPLSEKEFIQLIPVL